MLLGRCLHPACHYHPASHLKDLLKASSVSGVIQELHSVADFALRATKDTPWALSQSMSLMEVQEQQLWLNLADMRDGNKVHFLDAPI